MARRRRNRDNDRAEALIKLVFGFVAFVALAIGGLKGFVPAFAGLVSIIYTTAVLALVGYGCWRGYRAYGARDSNVPTREASPVDGAARVALFPSSDWNQSSIRQALNEIDWYQFEKFCAGLLEADGFVVRREGGARPDGGVDLVVEKGGARALIQCKHWRTWAVQEKVVREMLGSMAHFGAKQGAIYTLKGWTDPAAQFAAQHDITLVNGDELATSAAFQLPPNKLDEYLKLGIHHCPKCEAQMRWREGNFTPFWGCSRYPTCRGKLNHTGAR